MRLLLRLSALFFAMEISSIKFVKIEVICPGDILEKVLAEVKKAHPYEEPAIDIYPLLQYS